MQKVVGIERVLIGRAKKGDGRAFADLIARHADDIRGQIRHFRFADGVDEDVFSESVFFAWRGLPRFRFHCKFSSWMYAIVRNTACMRIRKEAVWLRPRHTMFGICAMRGSTVAEDHEFERRAQVQEALTKFAARFQAANIDESDRAVFSAFIAHDLPHYQVAELLKRTSPAVKSKLNRLRHGWIAAQEDIKQCVNS